MVFTGLNFMFHKNQKYKLIFDFHDYIFFRYQRLFFRSLISRGRKLWAFKFFTSLKYELKVKEKMEPNLIFIVSMMKITPIILLYKLRLGGTFYSVPFHAGERKKYTFGVKWVVKLIKDKMGRLSLKNVSDTLVKAIYNQGPSIEEKKRVYQLGISNRHLIHRFK